MQTETDKRKIGKDFSYEDILKKDLKSEKLEREREIQKDINIDLREEAFIATLELSDLHCPACYEFLYKKPTSRTVRCKHCKYRGEVTAKNIIKEKE